MSNSELQFGISKSGMVLTDRDRPDIDTRIARVAEAGVFDYCELSPLPDEVDAYARASSAHNMPIRAGGFYYTLGRDEPLLDWHMQVGAALGSSVQNVQIMTFDVDGRPVSDQDVAAAYLHALEVGTRVGVMPCLEVHVNMWSEHFGRVERVAALIERAGAPFAMTLDHSHVVFKIDNPEEQEVQNMRADVDSGALVLDPYKPGDISTLWIERNYVRHAHARATVPNGPPNLWARHRDGRRGRGIQYPFVEPGKEEWHSPWSEAALGPWKEIMGRLLAHHAREPDSPLQLVTTEYIPVTDYGAGARYSILDNNIACARWLRETWRDAQRDAGR
jgi:hypothetical protein